MVIYQTGDYSLFQIKEEKNPRDRFKLRLTEPKHTTTNIYTEYLKVHLYHIQLRERERESRERENKDKTKQKLDVH